MRDGSGVLLYAENLQADFLKNHMHMCTCTFIYLENCLESSLLLGFKIFVKYLVIQNDPVSRYHLRSLF